MSNLFRIRYGGHFFYSKDVGDLCCFAAFYSMKDRINKFGGFRAVIGV